MNSVSIQCSDTSSCENAKWDFSGVDVMDSMDIQCSGSASCRDVDINGTMNYIDNVNILCSNTGSCGHMVIESVVINTSFEVDCGANTACNSINAHFILMDDVNGSINCNNPSIHHR